MQYIISLKNVYVWYDDGLKIGRQTPHFNKNWVFLSEPSQVTFQGNIPILVTPLQSQNTNAQSTTNDPNFPYQLDFDFEKEFDRLCNESAQSGHTHVWKEYTGFTECYTFCEICDMKKKD